MELADMQRAEGAPVLLLLSGEYGAKTPRAFQDRRGPGRGSIVLSATVGELVCSMPCRRREETGRQWRG